MLKKNHFFFCKNTFFDTKIHGPPSGCKFRKHVFCLSWNQLSCFFCPFYDFCEKNVKKHILTSIWSLQHQNAGRNIPHPRYFLLFSLSSFFIFFSLTLNLFSLFSYFSCVLVTLFLLYYLTFNIFFTFWILSLFLPNF